jgi:hypothetical protein
VVGQHSQSGEHGRERGRFLEEADESEPGRGFRHGTRNFMEEDGLRLEDKFKYFWEAHIPSGPDEPEEGRWWSPEPLEPSSEEDEEEVRYLTEVLELGPQENEARRGGSHAPTEAASCTKAGSSAPQRVERQEDPPGTPCKGEPPCTKGARRRKFRKKVTKDKEHEWELARQGAWLREILTDNSESESEEKYPRFAEPRRWIAKMTGIPQQATTTSRGECSGQEKPDS